MSDQNDQRYTIQGREMIAETADLRVQILTLAAGEEVPWHHHTNVSDTFFCLDGPMLVETRSAEGDHPLAPGERCSTAPGTQHRVTGKDGGACRFVIVQGIGKYDYVAADG
jgi:quercetin dioxygenase-like cupin family protein